MTNFAPTHWDASYVAINIKTNTLSNRWTAAHPTANAQLVNDKMGKLSTQGQCPFVSGSTYKSLDLATNHKFQSINKH